MPDNARRDIRPASFTLAFIGLVSLSLTLLGAPALGQVVHADADYEASGYVTPAGMAPPSMYTGSMLGGPVQQVGFLSGSSSNSCDAYGCDSGGCDGCGGGSGGILGRLASGGGCGCCMGGDGCGCLGGNCGLSNLRHMCFFCRGSGCSACQMVGNGQILGMLAALRPYSEAGLCSQRWYDVSAEAVFLTHDTGGFNGALTSLGNQGPIVLSVADADGGDDTEAGIRLSGSLIFGAGGNIEGTWLGGHEWSSSASVSDPNAGLFSFISDFGNLPTVGSNGFDDTDLSLSQSVTTSSEFDSVELNYRRRTVGPYCRFQSSWLVGLRYVKFDSGLLYSTLGTQNNTGNGTLPRFFSSDEETENKLFGAQLGFDLWWNVMPGVSAGVGAKGAWLKNDVDRDSILTANSLGTGATPGTRTVSGGDETGTIMGEFEAKLVYRLTHSWSIRSAYYAIAVEDIGFSGVDVVSSQNFANVATGNAAVLTPRAITYDSLVVQGFSLGAEYIW